MIGEKVSRSKEAAMMPRPCCDKITQPLNPGCPAVGTE